MRYAFALLLLAGCAPNPCDVAHRNVSLSAYDSATRARLPPIVTVDGTPPQDLVCTLFSSTDDMPCVQVAFGMTGAHDVLVRADGFAPVTLMLDGGHQQDCGRDVPALQIDTNVALTPTP